MSDLKKVYLEDITINYDKLRIPLSSNERANLKKNYRYYGAQGVIDYVDRYIFDGEFLLVAEDGENLKSQNANVCNLVSGKFWVNNHAHILQANKNNNTKYIYYLLNLINFTPYITGSAQPKLNQENLNKIELRIHDLSNQNKIVSVLSALDSKIELNNRINAELEAMAKTVYDYWFVQFDFPNAEGKPYKSSGGKMVWSEELKREIPEGWRASLIADWILKDKNGDWGKETFEGNYTEHVSCIRGADINGLNGKSECNPPERYILKKNSNKQLNSHDLIVEISGGSPTQSTGRLAYLIDETLSRFENPLICSNFCKAIELKNKKQLFNFVYNWNRLYDNGVLFGYEGKTSGIKNLLFESFVSSYWVAIPNEELVNKFYDLMLDIEKKKQTALKENQQLSSLRDWLLPMLMNGQVSVDTSSYAEARAEDGLMAAEPGVEYKNNQAQLENYHKIQSVYTVIWANGLLGVHQGEMALAKDTYLVDKIAGLNTGFTFAQHNWGSYDPTFKKTINNKQYFARRNYANSKAIYFDLNDNGKLIDKIPDYIKESVRKTIEELDNKIFGKYHWSKKAEMKELYATVLKCIEDTQSIDLNVIRQAMTDWKTPKQEFSDKAAKFTRELTKEALDMIVTEKWDLKVIVEH